MISKTKTPGSHSSPHSYHNHTQAPRSSTIPSSHTTTTRSERNQDSSLPSAHQLSTSVKTLTTHRHSHYASRTASIRATKAHATTPDCNRSHQEAPNIPTPFGTTSTPTPNYRSKLELFHYQQPTRAPHCECHHRHPLCEPAKKKKRPKPQPFRY